MQTEPPDAAFRALADAEVALRDLKEGCCEPDRVPCIAELEGTLTEIHRSLGRIKADPAVAEVIVTALGDVGAQLGRLQVTCCTPKRMPLYARLLEDLTKVQLGVAATTGGGH